MYFLLACLNLNGQCVQEQNCFNNLILNGGFENDCVPGVGVYFDALTAPTNCLNTWQKGQGSPHLYTTPFVTPILPNGELFNLCLFAARSDNPAHQCFTETIFQHVATFAGQEYRFSAQTLTRAVVNNSLQTNAAPIDFAIRLAGNVPTNIPGDNICEYPIGGNPQTLLFLDEFTQQDWSNIQNCHFVANNNYSNIVFTATNDLVGESSSVFLDNIKLWCESQLELSATHTNTSGNTYEFNGLITNIIQGLNVASWHWDFGDGTTSILQNPTHTYAPGGRFNTCLCITDNRGCTRQVCLDEIQTCTCTEFEEITSDITYTGDVNFYKHLVIHPNVKVTFQGAHAKFLTNCKILVQRKARLNILSSTMEGGECGDNIVPWGGVQVWGSWTDPHTPTIDIITNPNLMDPNQGIVYVSASTIRNANNDEFDGAITAGPNSPFISYMDTPLSSTWEGYFGGIVITDNGTVIEDCKKGILLQRYPSPNNIGLTTSCMIRSTNFLDCRFGVASSWNENLTITNSTFGLVLANTIKSNTAITCLNGKTTITGSTISNYAHGIDGISSENPTMILNIGNLTDPSEHNYFNDCKVGITLKNVSSSAIYSNIFSYFNSNQALTGVWVDGPNNFRMYNNVYSVLNGNVIENAYIKGSSSSILNCNHYSSYNQAIIARGSNDLMEFNKEAFGNGNTAFYYDKSFSNNAKLPTQGSNSSPRINAFNNSIKDIYTPQNDFGQTDNFRYYYYQNAPENDPLRPNCAVNATYCTTYKGNFTEIQATNPPPINDCPPSGPVFCFTQLCLDSLNNLRLINANHLANGSSNNLLQQIIGYTNNQYVLSAMSAASPYLSDAILIAMVQNNNFTESQKLYYLLQHASISHDVRYAAANYLSSNSLTQIDAIHSQAQREIAEFELKKMDSHRWNIIENIVDTKFNNAGYNDILSLINSQADSLVGKRLLLGVQKTLRKWDEANATINALTELSNDYKNLLRAELNLGRFLEYTVSPSELALLDSYEYENSPTGSLARSIYQRIDVDRQYYPILPDTPIEERNSKDNDAISKSEPDYISLRPNPVSDYVDIELKTEYQRAQTELQYEVFTSSGQLLKSDKMTNYFLHIDTSTWTKGIYFIKLTGDQGVQVKKFIKL